MLFRSEKWWQGKYTLSEFHERIQSIRDLRSVTIENAGHMMHHDQPEQLAEHLSLFLESP